jgi:hypothetical protein
VIKALAAKIVKLTMAVTGMSETFSYTYTTVPHPLTGAPIDSVVGARSTKPLFRYILETAPAIRWRRVDKFLVSAPKTSVSDKTGAATTQSEALLNLFAVAEPHFRDNQRTYLSAGGRIRHFKTMVESGQMPPMFDPDVEES